MLHRLRSSALIAVAGCLVAMGSGCGSDGSDATTTQATTPRETLDKPPPLPRGWKLLINRTEGFSIGLPPGWRDTARGAATLIRSPDHLVAISITADRTNEALELPLDRFAKDTIDGLSGFEGLRADQPHDFPAHYDAVEVTATGRAKAAGVEQRLRLVLVRRPGIGAYPILIARNAKLGTGTYIKEIDRMLRSFRGRPVEVPSRSTAPR